MAVTESQFAAYIGAARSDETDRALQVAHELLTPKISGASREIPEAVQDQMILDVAADVRGRTGAHAGRGQFATPPGTNPQPARGHDPLARVRSTLSQYVVPF